MELSKLMRFGVVGAGGFIVDFTILLMLVKMGHLAPVLAKLCSFSIAVLFTFELNRRWSFRSSAIGSVRRAFATYLGVQGLGFLTNLLVFWLMLKLLSERPYALVIAAVAAAAVGLIINYAGARWLVFLRRSGLKRLFN